MSKPSDPIAKWLILRALGPGDIRVEPRGCNAESRPDGAAREAHRPHSSGHPGLPSDWLFSVAAEAVVIVEAATHRVVQANPAAAELLGISRASLCGGSFVEAFDPSSAQILLRAMNEARAAGVADEVTYSAEPLQVSVKVSIFRVDEQSFFLVRLATMSDDTPQDDARSPVFEAIENTAVGFVLTDSGLQVEYANEALTDMVGLTSPADMGGFSLARWLEFTADDLAMLRHQMLRRQATSVMAGRLRSERGSKLEVEVWAVAVPDGPHTCWGFTIRELPRLN